MKQIEFANILLETATETKKHFITATEPLQRKECRKIFEDLTELYFSLGLPDTLLPYMETLKGMEEVTNEYKMASVQALNHMIREVILYRRHYCIIRRTDPVPGLASHIMTNLGQIVAALKEGYIPVIDMQFSDNLFSALNGNHQRNAWELFFKQPFESHNLFTATKGENTVLKDGIPSNMPYYSMDQLTNPVLVQFWKDAMKRYLPFSDQMQTIVESISQELPLKESKILGVLCRGTDYTAMRPYNHPVQPDVDAMIRKAGEIMKEYQCDYCYLATEDKSILSSFQSAFGEQLLVSQTMYFEKEQTTLLSGTMIGQPQQLYEKNVEYLTSLYLLSRCHCFLAGRTSGAVVALLLNEKEFEYMHFWNEGKYGADDLQTLQMMML